MLQVGKPRSTIRFSFDQFEAIDVSLHGPGTVGQRESGQNRRFVPLDTTGKGLELPDGGCTYVVEPGVKSLTVVMANEVQKTMRKFSCLCQRVIHLGDPIELLSGLGR